MGQTALGKAIKPVLIGMILLAFALGAWLINDGIRLERTHQKQTHARAHDYAARAAVAVEARCRPLPASQELQCIHEENKTAREGAYNENDLKAQLVTSVWTRQMGIAAIIAMAFGVLGVGLVFVTYHATREGNQITLAAQRPWISIDVEVTEFRVAKEVLRFCCLVRFTNIGKTVASNVWTTSRPDFLGRDYAETALANLERWREMNTAGTFVALMPGEWVENEISEDFKLSEVPWFSVETNLKAHLAISAAAYYFTHEGRRADDMRLTERIFLVGGKNVNPLKQLVIHKARIATLNAETVVARRAGPSSTT